MYEALNPPGKVLCHGVDTRREFTQPDDPALEGDLVCREPRHTHAGIRSADLADR